MINFMPLLCHHAFLNDFVGFRVKDCATDMAFLLFAHRPAKKMHGAHGTLQKWALLYN